VRTAAAEQLVKIKP